MNSWTAPPCHAGAVLLEPLTRELVDVDTAAYLASPRAISAHSSGRWPVQGFTREDNLALLAQHEAEHEAGTAYAYAILEMSRRREVGCAYLRPLDAYLRRTGTVLAGVTGGAVATFWLIDDTVRRPSATSVLREIVAWVAAWCEASVVLRALPTEQESMAAIAELGLEDIAAGCQELPYRWFRLEAPPG